MGMNGSQPPVGEEDLHGFVDDEADAERGAAVRDFLAASPTDAARVAAWRRQIETIRAAFARVETEPVPTSVSLSPPARRSKFSCKLLSGQTLAAQPLAGQTLESQTLEGRDQQTEPLQTEARARDRSGRNQRQACIVIAAFASGIVATTLIGGLIARVNAPESTPTPADADNFFAARTRAALAAFAPTSATTQSTAAAPDKAAAAPSQIALILPNLSGIGLRFAGVRIAPNASDEMSCLFYAKAADLTVALCVERDEAAAAPGFHEIGHFPARAITWRQGGAKYALAGPLHEAELRALAARVHAEVDAFQAR